MENDVTGKPTAKQRVSRIPLDYHKRSDGLRKNRNRITVAAAVIALVLVAAMAVSREWHTAAVSPGPVARVHMAWERKCSVCHESFTPIDEDARLTSFRDRSRRFGRHHRKQKCRDCHRTCAAPPAPDCEEGRKLLVLSQ